MSETKRQKQVAGLINEELNDIFLRMGLNMQDGGMVSIASVKITPDLFEARVYLSIFQTCCSNLPSSPTRSPATALLPGYLLTTSKLYKSGSPL